MRAAHEGRVVNFGTRDTTLAVPPPHQTPHLQHGHTFRVGKRLGMHMGRGFYETNSGSITSEWKEAVAENGFSTFMGDNARKQPGSLQDILLHETAVSWLRKRLERTTPMKCWEESREAYGRRLKRCCEEVNKDCDVEGLCRGFPKRIRLLHDEDGGRLRY